MAGIEIGAIIPGNSGGRVFDNQVSTQTMARSLFIRPVVEIYEEQVYAVMAFTTSHRYVSAHFAEFGEDDLAWRSILGMASILRGSANGQSVGHLHGMDAAGRLDDKNVRGDVDLGAIVPVASQPTRVRGPELRSE